MAATAFMVAEASMGAVDFTVAVAMEADIAKPAW
jgi:hypothetical protein